MFNNYMLDVQFNIGIYIRLSQEDKDKKYETESESVINQRSVITDYININYLNKFNNYTIVGDYVDDGFSGTDFDRPKFKELIEDIKKKKINMVIVKDLSRLGRDHVMTGYYMENFFPENQVRFVSILDGYDSFKNQASNDSSTFIVACNDYYSKQNSIKIRNVLNNKRSSGKFIGSAPCFGYMRDPEDKGHLIPNPATAPIVKEIFKMAEQGIGVSDITTTLNNKGYITPSGYKGTKYSSRLVFRDDWNISSVKKIINNRIYTGDMVQHTQAKVSYKSKKKITLDESLWVVVENTHEPLVAKESFNLIQERKKTNNRTYKTTTKRPIRLFDGLLYCKECGNRLTIAYRKNHDYWSVNCNRYSRDPRRERCTSHFFPYNYLEEQIKVKIETTLSKYLKQFDAKDLNQEIVKREKAVTSDGYTKIRTLESRKDQIVKTMNSLYEDKMNSIVSSTAYMDMVKPHELELKKVNIEIESIKESMQEQRKNLSIIPDYTEQIKKLLDLKKPKRELLLSLIDRIEIDENRLITIKFKYGIISNVEFQYEETTTPRNPYGKKGKNNVYK